MEDTACDVTTCDDARDVACVTIDSTEINQLPGRRQLSKAD